MKAQRFTDTFLAGLRPGPTHYKVRDKSDAVGFGVQVARGGTRTFFVALSIDGKQVYIGLQRYRPPVTEDGARVASNLADQRDFARKLRSLRDEGTNPVRWLRERADERRVGTFADLLGAYVEHLGARPSAREIRRAFDRDVLSVIDGTTPAREVTAATITRALQQIHDRGKPVMANRVHSYVSAAFGFGRRFDNDPRAPNRTLRFGLAANPVEQITSHQAGEAGRERNLSIEEIGKLWTALDARDSMSPGTAALLKLALLTGQRYRQFFQARRREFDLETGVWVCPGPHMKARNPALQRPHAVPLVPLALEILREQLSFVGALEYVPAFERTPGGKVVETRASARIGDALVFPGRDTERALEPGTPNRAIKRVCERRDIGSFNAQDMRRTFKTRGADIGLTKRDRDLVQGHGRTTDVSSERYDWAEYLPEKRALLERWADYLMRTVGGTVDGRVVPIAAARRVSE